MNTKVGVSGEIYLSKRDDLHLARKAWHIGWGVLALSTYYLLNLSSETAGYLCLGISVLAFLFEYSRLKIGKVNELVFKYMGAFMRQREARGVSGLPFYALGMGLSLLFFSPKISLLAILYLVFSDPLSSIFGILFGKTKILPGKSLEGSFAGFCVCYCITLFYVSQFSTKVNDIIIFSLIAGVIGSLSELTSALDIDDNLTIPVLSAAGLTLLNYYFLIL